MVVGAGGDGAVGGGSSCHLPLEQLQDGLDVCCDPGLQSEEDHPVTSSTTNKNLLSDCVCVCVCQTPGEVNKGRYSIVLNNSIRIKVLLQLEKEHKVGAESSRASPC